MKTNISLTKSLKALATLVLGASLMLSTGAPASAQILNDITRRAKNAAETRIKMGADRAVHKTLDKAEKAVEKGAKNAVDNAGARGSKSGSSKVPEGRSSSAKAGNGSTWYVATSGSNKNDGKSPDSTRVSSKSKSMSRWSEVTPRTSPRGILMSTRHISRPIPATCPRMAPRQASISR